MVQEELLWFRTWKVRSDPPPCARLCEACSKPLTGPRSSAQGRGFGGGRRRAAQSCATVPGKREWEREGECERESVCVRVCERERVRERE